jgi:hypothetical protein
VLSVPAAAAAGAATLPLLRAPAAELGAGGGASMLLGVRGLEAAAAPCDEVVLPPHPGVHPTIGIRNVNTHVDIGAPSITNGLQFKSG